jgi:HEPN domain-containing protein
VDYRLADDLLKRKEEWTAGDICFHAQQCVEKYVKARLVLEDVHFRRTHNIDELIRLLPAELRPRVTVNERNMMTESAATIRYPGDSDATTLCEADSALRIARKVKSKLRRELPPDCLP